MKIKIDSEGPRHVHECEDCKPLPPTPKELEFKKQWFAHAAVLQGLKWNLSESDRTKLDSLMLELDNLVEVAAHSYIAKEGGL